MLSRWSSASDGPRSCPANPNVCSGQSGLSYRRHTHKRASRESERCKGRLKCIEGPVEQTEDDSLEDLPAYLLRWEQALRREDIQLAEIHELGPFDLAEFLAECARSEKNSAICLSALITRHLLCLKYANDYDFDTRWRYWRAEVIILRQQLKRVCEPQTVLDHLAGKLQEAYADGVEQFTAHPHGSTKSAPAATFQEEGLSVERLLGKWWPERLRYKLEQQGLLAGPESVGMFEGKRTRDAR